MITEERLAFINSARDYLLNDIKYNINPDMDKFAETIILYNLFKLEDWDKVSEDELKLVQNTIKCLEKYLCIPETARESTDQYLLLEDASRIILDIKRNTRACACSCS